MDDNEELWLEFIKRDIPRWEEYDLPEKSKHWYSVYCDLREQVQRSVDKDAAKLKMALDGISTERAKRSSKFVTDRRTIPLPRERPTTKQRYASYDRKMGGITPVFAAPKLGLSSADPLGTSAWTFETPQVPRSESSMSPSSFATTVPRKKSSVFSVSKRNKMLSMPMQKLSNRASQVKEAPKSLIEEHRRGAEPVAPRRKSPLEMTTPGHSKMRITHRPGSEESIMIAKRERETLLPASATGNGTCSPGRRRALSGGQETKSQIQGRGMNDDSSDNLPTQGSRPVITRKRPAPSVFLPPKKKKVA